MRGVMIVTPPWLYVCLARMCECRYVLWVTLCSSQIYVSTCPQDACSLEDQYPSSFSSRYQTSIAPATATVTLDLSTVSPDGCTGHASGDGANTCVVFVSVEVAGIHCPDSDACQPYLVQGLFSTSCVAMVVRVRRYQPHCGDAVRVWCAGRASNTWQKTASWAAPVLWLAELSLVRCVCCSRVA